MTKLILTAVIIFFARVACSQSSIWKADIYTGEYGHLKTNFFLQKSGGYWMGNTAADAHKRIVGGMKAAFAKSMFGRNAAIAVMDSLTVTDGMVSGYLVLDRRKYLIKGRWEKDSVALAVTGQNSGKQYGQLNAVVVPKASAPGNYLEMWQEIKKLTEQKIYNKAVLSSKPWLGFVKDMEDFSAIALDDLEFAYGFFYRAKELPFSHYVLKGNKEATGNYFVAGFEAPKDKLRPTVKEVASNTLLLDVPAFNFRANEVDSVMNMILDKNPQNLIIDLRRNTGGDMEGGMRICQYLSPRRLYGGILLSQTYWSKHSTPPDTANYLQFTPMKTADYSWFRQQVINGVEGLYLMIDPLPKTYQGNVYILTSSATASASEPVVYTLQKEAIAKVVGEKTSGSVISMEYFPVANLSLMIPMMEYYTADGKRLDKVGVQPDYPCGRNEALEKARTLISQQQAK